MKIDIGFDLDDTLIETLSAMCAYHNYRFGTKFTLEQMKDYYYTFKIDGERWDEFEFEFYQSEFNAQVSARKGAIEAVKLLKSSSMINYHMHVISLRAIESLSYTMFSLSQHFKPGDFSKIHLLRYLDKRPRLQKWQVCKNHNINLLVDDHPHHLNLAGQNGIMGILLETPWNRQAELHPLVRQARDWDEAIDILL